MKRQDNCIGCQAKTAGATPWQIGFIVGTHEMALLASDETNGDDPPKAWFCTLHQRMARAASALSFRMTAARGRARIAETQAPGEAKK